MPVLRSQFGGINSDLDANRLPSGTADIAINIDLSSGELAKRGGFAVFSAAVSGTTAVKNLFAAGFSSGQYHVVAKLADGRLYRRQVYPTDAGAFSAIETSHTHVGTDPGWGYLWADRFHYGDSGGISRWNPSVHGGVAYRDGLPKATTPVGFFAAGGEKEGLYHLHQAYRNSVTMEEGVVSTPSNLVECHYGDDTGGIGVLLGSLDGPYEGDSHVVYSTLGHTEYLEGETSVECFSYVAYEDVVTPLATAGCNKADHVLDHTLRFTNAGGEPPAAAIGCYTGSRAVYGGIPGNSKILYSIPGKPTMVPQNVTYTVGGDKRTVYPKPYLAEIQCPGEAVRALAHGGGATIALTPTRAYRLLAQNDGQLYATDSRTGNGACSVTAAVGTANGVHAIGYGTWVFIGQEGATDLAENRFSQLLLESADPSKTVMGYYGYKDQVWAAVVRTGDTEAQRILVWDIAAGKNGAMTVFDLACLGTRATMTTAFDGSNNDLTFTAERPGAYGNGITIAYSSTATAAGKEAVSVSGTAITVTMKAGATTAAQIAAAWVKCPDAMALASCANKGGDDGSGTISALAFTSLSGGAPGIKASWTTAFSGSNNDVKFEAVTAGAGGNSIRVKFNLGAASAAVESVTVSGSDITVNIRADATLASRVVTLWAASAEAVALATCALAAGNDGSGTIPMMGPTALASGADDEGITAMAELALPGTTPVMLVGTSKGRVLKYPSGTTDAGSAFGARYRGHWGQERVMFNQRLRSVQVHGDTGVNAAVSVALRGKLTSTADVDAVGQQIRITNGWQNLKATFDRQDARIFQADFCSDQAAGAWSIRDLIWHLDNMDAK